ncbi:polysaccharide biosynthesis protein, nucleotide sugar dehydrogenase, TviB family [Campylobacter showae]|uniref:Nucleotide sugar dehydrogenase n=1 Tax=Campylobacter showae RM3277 TaxID=553219 RepID=C6RIL6_9BACT|nr:Vi polysaccharide biosynthesis UDP-N-acetylglucosamine C-6 dehydrogenase TviB [Campylobacter showae]EET78759.1 nucleotide sugar dehydrogenase [Campylobacter showae RM3277]QCD49432.1 polysaccharide biosynthesis protein, nucleotide sugar dehydrogenase, TviB family [Campylobacter showae]
MKIAVIGLGYVGLPLAAAFSEKYEVTGFDVNAARIEELKSGYDRTLELSSEQMKKAIENGMKFSLNLDDIKDCNFFIVTVPTPIDKNKRPDLTPVVKATQSVAKVLKKGDIVVYESTVYPGVTEEICVPLLEESGLKFNEDFFCGYSPERINPGDKEHTVTKIKKITSGSTPEVADKVDEVYRSIITAGTHKAPTIKVAEAAKVIENTQRDINIAFMNELAMIFNKMNIDTNAVLQAAGTKWNFLNFRPGLVGGHCIGVDPYYLTHKAQELGFHPEMILAGRRINDNMGKYAADQVVKLMIKRGVLINSARVLVLGLTFKENCPDIRNSRVIDVIEELKDFGCRVDVYDPWADEAEVKHEYGIVPLKSFDEEDYDCVVIAVAHDKFKGLKFSKALVYDIKNVYENADARL